jgi:hypothetical protein
LHGLAHGDEQLERLACPGYVTNYVTISSIVGSGHGATQFPHDQLQKEKACFTTGGISEFQDFL